MTMKDSLMSAWRWLFPTIALAWFVLFFGGLFIWGRVSGDKPTWWWIVVAALAPIGWAFWRKGRVDG